MRRGDSKLPTYLRILFYGMPGSTKTRTALTACLDERLSPVLDLNSAGNPLAVRDYPKQPDVVEMEKLEDYNSMYNWLAAGQPKTPTVEALGLTPPYKTVVIDTITEVQRTSFNKQTGAISLGPAEYPARVERQHFGAVLAQMIQFARLFYSLPMHVIITCQEKDETNEATGAITHAPLLWGQSDVEVGGYAYIVARLCHRASLRGQDLRQVEDPAQARAGEKITSVAFFQPSGTYVAKDQYGMGVPYMVDPTITKIYDAIWRPK